MVSSINTIFYVIATMSKESWSLWPRSYSHGHILFVHGWNTVILTDGSRIHVSGCRRLHVYGCHPLCRLFNIVYVYMDNYCKL